MVIGITGISGSGKKKVAQFFERKHWVIIDVDQMAHLLYRPYTHVWHEIVGHFGEKILNQDDTINRTRLSKIVFNPSEPEVAHQELMKLNEMIHPALKREVKDKIHRHFRRKSNIVVVAALWQELDLIELTDFLLLVRSKPELCQKRIMERDNLPLEVYKLRVRDYKEPIQPEFKIDNDGTPEELADKLEQLYERVQDMPHFHNPEDSKGGHASKRVDQ